MPLVIWSGAPNSSASDWYLLQALGRMAGLHTTYTLYIKVRHLEHDIANV